ncbi:MAG: hypothetical protein M0004_02155 [Actinomycetota bacterium]|nr:hypothetical protein [Actinomycetota bacterium]
MVVPPLAESLRDTKGAVPPKRGDERAALSLLAQRLRPTALAREELFGLARPLAELIGTPGLRRGSTLVVEAAPGVSGASSLALCLLAGPAAEGATCAVVGLPGLGLLAAAELGVALERLVVVPDPGQRSAAAVAALLEGFDVVLAGFPAGLPTATARRLSARAKERRSVLIVAGRGVGAPSASGPAQPWGEAPEARLVAVASTWYTAPDSPSGAPLLGLFAGREVEVVARRRRAAPEEVRQRLLLPALEGAARPDDWWVGVAPAPDAIRAPRARRA